MTVYELGFKPGTVPLTFRARGTQEVNSLSEVFEAFRRVLPEACVRFDRHDNRNAELEFLIAAKE